MVQMWTPLQVFSNGYVYTDKFQLPLYNGIPNKVMSGVHNIFYYELIVMCMIVIITRDTLANIAIHTKLHPVASHMMKQ